MGGKFMGGKVELSSWMRLREKGGETYLVVRWWDKELKKRREKWLQITKEELNKVLEYLDRHEKIKQKLTKITCFNPSCSRTIYLTEEQKRDFLISFAKKYDATVLPTCSKKCQQELLQLFKN